MIISASRRTDIPAFYADWFFHRLKAGTVTTKNPMNLQQIRQLSLRPEDVDGFVFWSKNPQPMLQRLHELEAYPYYFQITLTPYAKDIEPGLPDKKTVLLPALKALAEKAGANRVIWRYDPIFFFGRYTQTYHLRAFETISNTLSGKIDTCVISFLDEYAGMRRRMGNISLPDSEEMVSFAAKLRKIGETYGIRLTACCEPADFTKAGIFPASCIDAGRLAQIAGRPVKAVKDKNQRPSCHCCASVDLGAYQTCPGGCLYCYANRNFETSELNFLQHDPCSESLF